MLLLHGLPLPHLPPPLLIRALVSPLHACLPDWLTACLQVCGAGVPRRGHADRGAAGGQLDARGADAGRGARDGGAPAGCGGEEEGEQGVGRVGVGVGLPQGWMRSSRGWGNCELRTKKRCCAAAALQAAGERLASFRRTVERCHSQAQELQSYTDSLFQGLFAHRFRHGTAAGGGGARGVLGVARALLCNRRTARAAPAAGDIEPYQTRLCSLCSLPPTRPPARLHPPARPPAPAAGTAARRSAPR